MKRKKVNWKPNDIFAIKLINEKSVVGHILDQHLINTVCIAIYDEILADTSNIDINSLINSKDLISLIEVTREKLDFGAWEIIGVKENTIPIEQFPNEQYRSAKWVNSVMYDAGLAEDFVNAYYSLTPWDDWYDPNYLDKFLISPYKKPDKLLYKKENSAPGIEFEI
ncbi:MAG: Imm26 family immunity protein [Mucilaginibacter sp.]